MSVQRERTEHASASIRGHGVGPATLSLERQALLVIVILRLSSAAVAAVVALLGPASSANPAWVLLTVAGVLVWAGSFGILLLGGAKTVGAGVVVDVLDQGRGFDLAAVPAHRMGLRAADGSASPAPGPRYPLIGDHDIQQIRRALHAAPGRHYPPVPWPSR